MPFSLFRVTVGAVLVFLVLFLFRLLTEPNRTAPEIGLASYDTRLVFEGSRKNYATAKTSGPGPGFADSQKYEKIASVTQLTDSFERDRKRIDALITDHHGIIQLERASGLLGFRILHLGIGVPPERFDSFIDAARSVGKTAQVEIVKNDKTNEYLQLRAKRTTLEKARTALESLREQGGSTDERVKVQNRLTEIEQQIQDLGVALGDFDRENELCTVKLTLRERATPVQASLGYRVLHATEWTAFVWAGLGGGLLMLVIAGWLGAGLVTFALRLVRHAHSGEIA
jgi:hypothetical protein